MASKEDEELLEEAFSSEGVLNVRYLPRKDLDLKYRRVVWEAVNDGRVDYKNGILTLRKETLGVERELEA